MVRCYAANDASDHSIEEAIAPRTTTTAVCRARRIARPKNDPIADARTQAAFPDRNFPCVSISSRGGNANSISGPKMPERSLDQTDYRAGRHPRAAHQSWRTHSGRLSYLDRWLVAVYNRPESHCRLV